MKHLTATIEIPKNTIYKYENKDGILVLDRVLNQALPQNYGYINDLPFLGEDGDALDVFVMSRDPIVPFTELKIEIKGIFYCLDNNVADDKILATIVGDTYLKDDWSYPLMQIQTYLHTYKQNFVVTGYDQIDQLPNEYFLGQED